MRNLPAHLSLRLAALAAFFFVFLSLEYYYDTMLAFIVPSSQVVLGQGTGLGASVLGFGAFCFVGRAARRVRMRCAVGAAVAAFGCACLLCTLQDPTVFQAVGCLTFCLIGAFGGFAHWKVAECGWTFGRLATAVGGAYALGILCQSCLLALCPDLCGGVFGIGFGMIVLLGMCLLVDAKAAPSPEASAPTERPGQRKVIWAVVIVALMALMFVTLDNMMTLANAEGEVALAGWPRLLLAASAVLAGALFDLKRKRFMDAVMFCILLISTITILVFEAGHHAEAALVFFYVTSGFFVTYFTTRFMVLAPSSSAPLLCASLGRIVNNVCAFAFSWTSLLFIRADSLSALMIASIVLLVMACVAFVASGAFQVAGADETSASAVPSLEARQLAFAKEHGLTPRESEVLVAVVSSEKPLKGIAAELGISLRMLQKHLTSIYQKTDTQTRAGLVKRILSFPGKTP